MSHAIDAVLADPRCAPLLVRIQVSVYGMSAGGLTALTFAGGRCSPALFVKHCEAHIEEDFPACFDLIMRLKRNWGDSSRIVLAKAALRLRFGNDQAWQSHDDARVRAVVAAGLMAAVSDPAALASPRVALGLIEAAQDA